MITRKASHQLKRNKPAFPSTSLQYELSSLDSLKNGSSGPLTQRLPPIFAVERGSKVPMSGQVPTGHLPALVPTDDDHQQASIIIATTILLFTALLFVGARLWVRCNPDEEQRKGTGPRGSLLGGDDLLIVTSTVSLSVCSLEDGQTEPALLHRRKF